MVFTKQNLMGFWIVVWSQRIHKCNWNRVDSRPEFIFLGKKSFCIAHNVLAILILSRNWQPTHLRVNVFESIDLIETSATNRVEPPFFWITIGWSDDERFKLYVRLYIKKFLQMKITFDWEWWRFLSCFCNQFKCIWDQQYKLMYIYATYCINLARALSAFLSFALGINRHNGLITQALLEFLIEYDWNILWRHNMPLHIF